MATQVKMASKAPISMNSHTLLMDFVRASLTRQGSWWRDKLERTDMMYYCMQSDLRNNKTLRARAEALDIDIKDMLEVPIIASQIETAVAVLADTFLAGYPLFGVVAPPERRQEIEQLETLVSHYDTSGKWRSALLRYFRHLTKYSLAPIGLGSRYTYDLSRTIATGLAPTTNPIRQPNASVMPELEVPDPYNMVFDWRVAPNEIHKHGDYISWAKILPATAVKAMLIALSESSTAAEGRVFNLDKWPSSTLSYANYHMHPVISMPAAPGANGRWERWYNSGASTANPASATAKAFYQNNDVLLRKYQARLVPAEFELTRYGGSTPMVFEFWVLNDSWIVYFAPLILDNNTLSMTFTDLQDDDFGYAGKTETEMFAPFQQASSILLNSAVLSAERIVDDRAIYDPNYISASNLTRHSGSAYIPLTLSLTNERPIAEIYKSIPFDARSAFQMPSLIREIVNTSTLLRGRNNFAQGLPQKGNRTLGEFSELMSNSDSRQQLPAMLVEVQAFTDLKAWIKQWIAANATPQSLLNHRTKAMVKISPETVRDLQYDFALATGYFSKRLLANTDMLQQALQAMQNSPQLQERYDVAGAFAYLMSLSGVKDMDQFKIEPPAQPAQPAQSIPAQPPLTQE